MKSVLVCFSLVLITTFAVGLTGQGPVMPSDGRTELGGNAPGLPADEVVAHTVHAVNYGMHKGSSKVDFIGTDIMPGARGEGSIESKKGYTEIKVHFDELKSPCTICGPEYLTYVLWAVTPEGRASNLGEVVLSSPGDDGARLEVTTELQAFGLVVTAEPYFAVIQPSDAIVLENIMSRDAEITGQTNTKFGFLRRGMYVVNAGPELAAMPGPGQAPLELAEACNAVQIAMWAGAAQHAPDTLEKAQILLGQAQNENDHGSKRKASSLARQAVQTAEDARLIAVQLAAAASLANERAVARNKELAAQAEIAKQARQLAEAEAATRLEAERRVRAETEQREAELRAGRAEAEQREADRIRAEAELRAEKAQAELARVESERNLKAGAAAGARAQAGPSTTSVQEQIALTLRAADRLKAEADDTKARAEEAGPAVVRSDAEANQLRANLRKQLSAIFEIRETARGLIVNLSDVLFDSGQYTLKAGAREKLAKVSGILLTQPGLKIEVEGYTDNVGTAASNQVLSLQRAESVRSFLVSQKIPPATITAEGFGANHPVASNSTAAGRQRNRRVELVVSGAPIGITQ